MASSAGLAALLAKSKGQMKLLHGRVTQVSKDETYCFVTPEASSSSGSVDIYVGSQVPFAHAAVHPHFIRNDFTCMASMILALGLWFFVA